MDKKIIIAIVLATIILVICLFLIVVAGILTIRFKRKNKKELFVPYYSFSAIAFTEKEE